MSNRIEVGDVVILNEVLTSEWSSLRPLSKQKLLVVGFSLTPDLSADLNLVYLLRLDGKRATKRRNHYTFNITSLVKVS